MEKGEEPEEENVSCKTSLCQSSESHNDSTTQHIDSITNENSGGCFSESTKEDRDKILVFGNASNTTTKDSKSALFEFGSNTDVPEQKPTEIVSGFDSADSTNDFDFSTHEAIQSAINIVDLGLQASSRKCFDNENKISANDKNELCESVQIHKENSSVCNNSENSSSNDEERTTDEKGMCELSVGKKLSSVGSSSKEGLAVTCDEERKEEKEFDNTETKIMTTFNQSGESDYQHSQSSKSGNNTISLMIENDVSNINLGRQFNLNISPNVNQHIVKTVLNINKETSVDDQSTEKDQSLLEENVNKVNINNSKIDGGSATTGTLLVDNECINYSPSSEIKDLDVRTKDSERDSTIDSGKMNVDEYGKIGVINEKLTNLQQTDNTMDCTFNEQLGDGDHTENMIVDDESTETGTSKISEVLSNLTFHMDENNRENFNCEISNTSNKTIEVIKDSTNGNTLSVTLEDVEVSVFEASTDKLSTIVEPTQKNKEVLNEFTDKGKLDFETMCSDNFASQPSDTHIKIKDIENDQAIDNSISHHDKKGRSAKISNNTNLDVTTLSKNLDNKTINQPVEFEECGTKRDTLSGNMKNEKQNVSSTEVVISNQETNISQVNKHLGLVSETKLISKDNDSDCRILENCNNILTDPESENRRQSIDITVESKQTGNIESKLLNNTETNPNNDDLESLMLSTIKKNEEFRKNVETEKTKIINAENSCVNVESDDTEVICLVDDDDDCQNTKVKPAAAIKCVNPNCMSGLGLDKPAMFVLSYFGLKRSKDQLVCTECFNMVVEHQEKLAALLKEKKPLFTAEFPSHKDIILLDSDEESVSDNDSLLSDGTMELIQENLDDVINECLTKYCLDHQIRESCHILNNKVETMEEDNKELDKRFDQVQRTLDEFRKTIYQDFNHPIQEIEEVHFTDCEIPPMPILRNKYQNQMYNKELMNSIRRSQHAGTNSLSQHQSSPGNSRTIATKKVTQISQSPNQYDNMSQDVIAVHSELRCEPPPNLPPPGPLVRPKLNVGDTVYVMKVSYFSIWVESRILETIPRNPTENDASLETYRVRMENMKKNAQKQVTGKYLAYLKPSKTQLKVGTRVIAIFKEEYDNLSEKENYYVGVVAEPPKSTNKFRYLVFFDDGYTQYCPHENIRVVCYSSKNVWEDLHPEPRNFIRNYLQQYPERPMVKLSQNQVVKVEWNGRWWIVRVLEVDASLVKVHFDADRRTEWIYRGSTRLGPMFLELAAAKERQSGSLPRSRGLGAANYNNSDMPYVEYTRGDGDEKKDEDKDEQEEEQQPVVRSVARKSTAKKPPEPVQPATNQLISNPVLTKPLVSDVPQGKVSDQSLKPLCKARQFRPHQCNKFCLDWTKYNPSSNKRYVPLVIPLIFGFERINMVFRGKTVIMYRAPCGRTIRSPQEMLCYLQCTKSSMTIDLFDFDFWVNPLSTFEEGKTFCRIEDLSYGKENVPISCVNELDHSMPQYVQYMTARQPAKDVHLNLDPEFLVGCDCTDDCEDRSKCSCWQLTLQGKSYVPDGDLDPLFGYQHRRLPERIATGIYECNSKCKCSATCQNRVAQQPLSFRLQLFKTLKKGWGIRCLHDIPRGAFICIYAGFLLTETEANEGGKTYGDEYLAELDYIESVEGLKEGYESEARDMSDVEVDDEPCGVMDIEYDQEQTVDSDGESSSVSKTRQEDIRLRLRRRTVEDSDKDSSRKSKQDDDSISISDDEEDSAFRTPQKFNANITESEERQSNYPSVRDLYGQGEQVYIMDAKTHGNIGRYLNHSCSPNVFVQNVFVDTHDLRFPWVSFFANQYIPAGTELTWDYNYDVGSVPGKIMLCYCGSPNCRGRLL